MIQPAQKKKNNDVDKGLATVSSSPPLLSIRTSIISIPLTLSVFVSLLPYIYLLLLAFIYSAK